MYLQYGTVELKIKCTGYVLISKMIQSGTTAIAVNVRNTVSDIIQATSDAEGLTFKRHCGSLHVTGSWFVQQVSATGKKQCVHTITTILFHP